MRQPFDVLTSVITPSYNHAGYIRQTIESVLTQDWPNIEHIVVDGGSTDGTVEILRGYGERYPDRFRWVSEPDRGQSHAFNKGLTMAHGEIIGWQNSDDYYHSYSFGEPLRYLVEHREIAGVYSTIEMLDVDGRLHAQPWSGGPFSYARLLDNNYISNQAAFFRKDELLAVGGLDESLHYAMDYDLYLRLGLRCRLEFVPGVRGVWRALPTVKTVAGLRYALRERVRILERALNDERLDARVRTYGLVSIQGHIFNALVEELLHDDRDGARAMLEASLRYDSHMVQWRRLLRLLFIQPRMAAFWGGQDDPEAAAVPDRLLAALAALRRMHMHVATHIVSLAYLARAVQAKRHSENRHALRYLIRLQQTDPGLAPYVIGMLSLLHVFQGEGLERLLSNAAAAGRWLGWQEHAPEQV